MRLPTLFSAFLPLLLPVAAQQSPPLPQAGLARQVEIVRDRYGVPHIYGKTDAATVFGLMYAQAEDNFWQLEDDYIRGLGRYSEIAGQRGLLNDLAFRLLEHERLAREEYAAMTPAMRALCDAAAAGVNHYLATHPEVKPRLLTKWEPWYILAFQSSDFSPGAFARMGIGRPEIRAAFPDLPDEVFAPAQTPQPPSASDEEGDEGSNMWAVRGAKSASGNPLLFINPHVGFFGGGQRYEAHLISRQGLNVSGFAILGTPYIRTGFTAKHGWSHTNNNVIVRAVYKEAALAGGLYRHGSEQRKFTEWGDEIKVRFPDGMRTYKLRLRRTHHGPVFAVKDGSPITVWVAKQGKRGLWEQRLGMAKAKSLRDFQTALEMRAIVGSNTLYADRKGNIFYIHGNAIPKRDPRFDWATLLDGSDPATDPQGYHELRELPQATNPASNFLQNCNSTPFLMAGADSSPRAAGFPSYVAPEPDNLRSEVSRQILTERQKFTYEEWTKAATDPRVLAADKWLPELFETAAKQTLDERLRDAVDALRKWDRKSAINSVPMTLFFAWSLQRQPQRDPVEALRLAMASLEKDHGTWRVAWGEVNRLQRVHTSGTEEPFSDAKPSVPVVGARGTLGTVFAFTATQPAGQKRMYGTSGNTYVAVLEFGKKLRSQSIVTLGQSANPESPHFFDQGPIYARGQFKPAWYSKGDVMANSSCRYKPGNPCLASR